MKVTRTIIKIGAALALTCLLAAPATVFARMGNGTGPENSGQCPFSVTNIPIGELSEDEEATLLYMRQEEKLARDVYLALYEQWGVGVFANIARSEARHMASIKALIDKYELTDPVENDTRGLFSNPNLQALYTELLTKGQASLVEALTVGATIEDLDIYDLQSAMEESDDEDVRTVYQNLMKGSRNHLRSFVYQLSLNNAEYTAQYITTETYEAIISSPKERGYYNEDGEPAGGFNGLQRNFGNGYRGCIGPTSGISTDSADFLLAGRGRGKGNGQGGGRGPGDGTGNGGNGPRDGSGNGKIMGTCVNS